MVKDGVLRTSPMLRLFVMGVVLFALNAPLTMMCGVVQERAQRREQTIKDVSDSWGREQTVAGPALMIPYRYLASDGSGTHEVANYRYLMPDTLDVVGTLDPEQRGRGIFKTTVYTAHLKARGRFAMPDFREVQPRATTILWDQAVLLLRVEDARGIASVVASHWDGHDGQFQAATNPLLGPVLSVSAQGMTADRTQPVDFDITLDIRGTRSFRVLPGGTQTTVDLTSRWPHPSFIGTPPTLPRIDAGGFQASWNLPGLVRSFPHAWNASDARVPLEAQFNEATLGVALIEPVDLYAQTERAVKYAVLFIVMTFAIAFIWEITKGAAIHPVQYIFIGFGMCLFYMLLLSLGEHLGFDLAYGLATAAIVTLLSWYWRWVLRGRLRGAAMGAALSVLYGYLYLLLRLEDFALLAGSLGLFLMLALMMFLTRRVDWFNLRAGTATETVQGY